jgi:hypothetical protein
MTPQPPPTLILSFREFGREPDFRDRVIRSQVVSSIRATLEWHGLLCDYAGEGRADGEVQSYLRVHHEAKALLVARCEAQLLDVPWVNVLPLLLPDRTVSPAPPHQTNEARPLYHKESGPQATLLM